jgi:hypothetical protein
MKRLTCFFAAASAALAISQAFASDWRGQPPAVKRQMVTQMIACMKKRMEGDRLVSYNQASKLCRDEVQARLDKARAGLLVADTGEAR